VKSIQVLRDKHKGTTGFIVGKGPSLLKLRAGHFECFNRGPIIAINHAIHAVEALGAPSVYSMQRDGCDINERGNNPCEHDCNVRPLGSTGNGGYPKYAVLILSHPESWFCYPNHPERYVFSDVNDLGFSERIPPSLPNAVMIAELMGVKEIKLLCFDSINGDARAVHFDKILASHERAGGKERLKLDLSSAQLAQEAMTVPFEWVTIE